MSNSQKTNDRRGEELTALRQRVSELESAADEHRQMEPAHRPTEERYHKIFDHSNDAIFLVDPVEDAILDVNAKACEILGYSREELLSVPMSVVHPHEMPRLRAFAQSVFKEGKGWTDELTCLTRSGVTLSAEFSASMIEIEQKTCMIAMVRDVSDRERLARENDYLHDEIRAELRIGSIKGNSEPMRKVLEQIQIVAPTDASVLVTGESGTGKELVARGIHDQSDRAKRPLVRVNCASIPSELFESEFFGHVKGAFTGAVKDRAGRFELADGGTIFLDEIGEIPLGLQSKLLRVLQEGEFERVGEERTRKVNVRIVAATNRDLLTESKAGRFRQDLYYRLSVFPIEIPPLRDRREDIGPLTEYFVEQSSTRLGVPHPKLTKSHLRYLEQYAWPGNVRELQNVIERAVILSRGGRLQFDLGAAAAPSQPPRKTDAASPQTADELTLDDVKRMERDVIVGALEQSGWRVHGEDGAAGRLGLKPTTLSSKMKKMGIQKPS
ncbi:MAG: sigma 54-interacting transcriptional regulator [Planctomycetota bacterium]|nr:sigma 54-interacting transcriptional regulator [Planctomycetota bacterium]